MDLTPYGLWTVALDLQPAPEARRAAAEIEAMGWGAIWIPEAVNREVMSNSMLLLGATEKLVVATGIANLHARTPMARGILGAGKLLCPEQAVVLEADPATARGVASAHMRTYLGLPNYTNNLKRFGWTDADIADGGSDALVDAIVAWGSVDDVT